MSYLLKSFLLTVLLCFSVFSSADNFDENVYSLPIKYASQHQDEISNIIIKSMVERQWSVKSQKPGLITAWLENYKGYRLVIDISYTDSKISFKYVDFKKLDCMCNKKRYKQYYITWRLNLRSTINKNLHQLNMLEQLKDPTILALWLKNIETGSHEEKLKIGRYIFELSLFEPRALKALEKEVKANYLNKLDKHDIQVYAFYCKSLASTKDVKYEVLLTNVSNNAKEKALRKYVEGYLKTYFDNG